MITENIQKTKIHYNMNLIDTTIEGCFILNTKKNVDNRGYFERLYCFNEFKKLNIYNSIAQINTSYNNLMGTLRGLHLQSGVGSETKIVRCIAGSIWDVVVYLRSKSSTFGKWYATNLNYNDYRMILIPEGCAHGFITLEDRCEIMYFVSNFYQQSTEITLNWSDPQVGINWPMKPKIMSSKDKHGLSMDKVLEIMNSIKG